MVFIQIKVIENSFISLNLKMLLILGKSGQVWVVWVFFNLSLYGYVTVNLWNKETKARQCQKLDYTFCLSA